jgi:hypothetical protein
MGGAVARLSQAAAQGLGLQLHIVRASSDGDFDAIFEQLVQQRVGALVIGPDTFFTARSEQLAKLTVRHAMPAVLRTSGVCRRRWSDELRQPREASAAKTNVARCWGRCFNVRTAAIADVEDLTVALAAYQAACKRWPRVAITLRQGSHASEGGTRPTDLLDLAAKRSHFHGHALTGGYAPSRAPNGGIKHGISQNV